MTFNFKLKIIINVCLILLLYSLPTKQDRRHAEGPLQSPVNKIGETIEEPDTESHEGGVNFHKDSAESHKENSDPLTENAQHSDENAESPEDSEVEASSEIYAGGNCWIEFNVTEHFTIMDDLDEKYLSVRESYNSSIMLNLNSDMMCSIFQKKGVAERAVHNTEPENRIPAGFNLGGYTMLKLQESILFFHRMKLRNDTVFNVNKLQTNLVDMTINADLFLNDLHLVGAYERSTVGKDPSILYHAPSFGELEILLKDVSYSMEGSLRLQNQRLVVENVNSQLILQNNSILITYADSNHSKPISIPQKNIAIFLDKMTNIFDHWLKDFFNDYFIYNRLKYTNDDFITYESERLRAYNNFASTAIRLIRKKIFQYRLFQVVMPNFTLVALPNVEVKLFDGIIYGFETVYKRSVATGKKKDNRRYVDAMLGFGKIKAEYSLIATIPNQDPLVGHLVYSTHNIAAKLRIEMVDGSNDSELSIKFDSQFSPDSLTVEGSASQFIPNFRHLIETHAISIMSTVISHNINLLSSITKCTPNFRAADKPDAYTFDKNGKLCKTDANNVYQCAPVDKERLNILSPVININISG